MREVNKDVYFYKNCFQTNWNPEVFLRFSGLHIQTQVFVSYSAPELLQQANQR